jgi:hypothetical protein
MNKNNVNIILSIALIAAFFLPFLSVPGLPDFSGFNVVFGKGGMTGIAKGGKFLFICLLIPLGGIILLFDALGGGSSSSDYAYWMPIIGVVILTVLMFAGMSQGAANAGGRLDIKSMFRIMGYGYWITAVASILLLVNKSRV